MKYRIKIVTYASGHKRFYPQEKKFFIWLSMGRFIFYETAKACIDEKIQEKEAKDRRKKKEKAERKIVKTELQYLTGEFS